MPQYRRFAAAVLTAAVTQTALHREYGCWNLMWGAGRSANITLPTGALWGITDSRSMSMPAGTRMVTALLSLHGPIKESPDLLLYGRGASARFSTLKVSDTGRLNAIARIEPGNPSGHDDGGRRWSCDDLLSGGFPRRLAREFWPAAKREQIDASLAFTFSPSLSTLCKSCAGREKERDHVDDRSGRDPAS